MSSFLHISALFVKTLFAKFAFQHYSITVTLYGDHKQRSSDDFRVNLFLECNFLLS